MAAGATSPIPEAQSQDGRLVISGYDSNLQAWPNQAPVAPVWDANYQTYATGYATVSTTVNSGGDAQRGGTVFVCYNGVFWYFPVGTAVAVPKFIRDILTATGSPYSVT